MSNHNKILEQLGGKEHIRKALRLNIEWINKSFQVNNNQGSSAYQHLLGWWSSPYPETTGYLLPTLLDANVTLPDGSLRNLAFDQLSFFRSLQSPQGGFYSDVSKQTQYFFDCSQIHQGLLALYKIEANATLESLLKMNYQWMISQINADGEVIIGNYQAHATPSYYSRSCWALIETESIWGIDHNRSVLLLGYIQSLKNNNGSYRKWSFDGSEKAYSHTLVYTWRGLFESALLLQDELRLNNLILDVNVFLEGVMKPNGNILWGEYSQSWEANKRFICSVGNAQLALLLLRIYTIDKDPKYLEFVPNLIRPLMKAQFNALNRMRGAVPSSIPFWEKYQRAKYTNWTQKFYSDVLIELLRLEEK